MVVTTENRNTEDTAATRQMSLIIVMGADLQVLEELNGLLM